MPRIEVASIDAGPRITLNDSQRNCPYHMKDKSDLLYAHLHRDLHNEAHFALEIMHACI